MKISPNSLNVDSSWNSGVVAPSALLGKLVSGSARLLGVSPARIILRQLQITAQTDTAGEAQTDSQVKRDSFLFPAPRNERVPSNLTHFGDIVSPFQ